MGNELDCRACCQKRGGWPETNWLFDCRFSESELVCESVQEGTSPSAPSYQGEQAVPISQRTEKNVETLVSEYTLEPFNHSFTDIFACRDRTKARKW